MKKIAVIIFAVCMLPLFSCSAVIESQLETLSENLDELGDELDDLGDNLDDLGDELDDLSDDFDNLGDDFNTLYHNDSSVKIIINGESYSKKYPNVKINKNDKLITRKFNINEYKALSVGYNFQVVMCDTIDAVTVRVNEKLDKYLVVKVKNGTLNITLDRIGGIKSDNAKCGYVYLPYNLKLNSISLSGTATFATTLPINVSYFDLELSGASSFKAKVNCTKYAADLSGTAHCRSDVKCKNADIDLSGASKHESNISCTSLIADLSGTSVLRGNITAASINADLSGASIIQMAGKCDKLTADICGTSKLDCKKLKMKKLSGDMSGASKAVVNCSDELKMGLSGTSHLVYYGNPKTDIDASRATTVERK